MAKLRTTLPEGDRNGLSSITGPLCDHPERKHMVLIVVDCKSVNTDMDTGEITPSARILRIEPVSRVDYPTAEKLMRRALETRHGSTVLPFDTESELTDLFAEISDKGDGPEQP